MHGSKVMLCIKNMQCKYAQLRRAITHEVLFRIYSKVNQVIYSSIPIHSSGFKALASIVFRYFADKISSIFFSKGHNSGKGHNPNGKKNTCQLFFIRNQYMKLQNPSMHGLEVILCIKKHAM